MFESLFLLIFYVFFGGASRCSHVAKLAHRLMDRDQKNKFTLPIKSWILLIFNFNFFPIVVYNVIFSMTISIQHQGLGWV